MDIVVYTAIFGGKDYPTPQPYEEGVRYVIFTDAPVEINGWENIVIPIHRSPRRTARMVKALSHKYFPDSDYTIWIDGNMQMLYKPSYYVKKYGEGIACRPHPEWQCIYTEALKIQEFRYENDDIIIAWVKKLIEEGYPENNLLGETGFLVRNTRFYAIKEFENLWWECIDGYSQRDQLSFDYVHWKLGTNYKRIDRKEVRWLPHKVATTYDK